MGSQVKYGDKCLYQLRHLAGLLCILQKAEKHKNSSKCEALVQFPVLQKEIWGKGIGMGGRCDNKNPTTFFVLVKLTILMTVGI